MREQAVTFGETHTLVGVVTEPDPTRSGAPALILLNAGLLHRVGPNRLYVTLARELAARGLLTLRFDHSGLGDSDTRRDYLNYSDGVTSDTRLAMSFLAERYGVGSFIVGGLCSGADHAFLTAIHDSRVQGGILIDWYAYRTLGYHIRHYGPKLIQVGPWRRTIKRLAKWIRTPRSRSGQSTGESGEGVHIDPFARYVPARNDVALALDHVLARGTQLLCVYTGGQEATYNYAQQFVQMFRGVDLRGLVQTHFLPASTHTFTLAEHRRRLEEIVLEWSDGLTAPSSAERPSESPARQQEDGGHSLRPDALEQGSSP